MRKKERELGASVGDDHEIGHSHVPLFPIHGQIFGKNNDGIDKYNTKVTDRYIYTIHYWLRFVWRRVKRVNKVKNWK